MFYMQLYRGKNRQDKVLTFEKFRKREDRKRKRLGKQPLRITDLLSIICEEPFYMVLYYFSAKTHFSMQ